MQHVQRFSDRAGPYARYRPSYPNELLDTLEEHGLSRGAWVADMGSGTGILAALLLARGAQVFGVEPNDQMRDEADGLLGGHVAFHSIAATAEDSGLPEGSIDLITAAQAFHWFDKDLARSEWRRIAKPGAWVALIWNERVDDDDLTRGFGQLARAFVDRQKAETFRRLANPAAEIDAFFSTSPVVRFEFPNAQVLTLDGLKGRALSSSYWPTSGTDFEDSMKRLEDLFAAHSVDGLVRITYRTEVFLGQVW